MNDRISRWEKATALPLAVASGVFLVAFALPIIWYPDIPGWLRVTCQVVELASWLAFLIDYLVRLGLSNKKLKFIATHVLDLLVVALPMLRPLRVVRVVTLMSMFKRRAGARARAQVGLYLVIGTVMMTFVGALAVLDAEREVPGANITTVGDSIWWAITTMTTVGYGDKYPITGMGRFFAAVLMICGVAIVGAVTATLSSWIIEKMGEGDQESHSSAELVALRNEVEKLTGLLAEVRHHGKPDQANSDPNGAAARVADSEAGAAGES